MIKTGANCIPVAADLQLLLFHAFFSALHKLVFFFFGSFVANAYIFFCFRQVQTCAFYSIFEAPLLTSAQETGLAYLSVLFTYFEAYFTYTLLLSGHFPVFLHIDHTILVKALRYCLLPPFGCVIPTVALYSHFTYSS